MIALLTKSPEVSKEIIKNCPTSEFCVYPYDELSQVLDPVKWFSEQKNVSQCTVLFFDTSICVDTAPFRLRNPNLKCIALVSPGDENEAEDAMKYGAFALLQKPLIAQEISGVLTLAVD